MNSTDYTRWALAAGGAIVLAQKRPALSPSLW